MNDQKPASCNRVNLYPGLIKWGVFLVLSVISFGIMGQKIVDTKFVGNWANSETGAWEYGFYEDGAVACSDFWKYKRVKLGERQIEIVLENGHRTMELKMKQGRNGNISITRDRAKKEMFRPCDGKNFVAWTGDDTVSFLKPLTITDTVTIRGYIHNLDKVTHPALRRYTFTCSYNELLGERGKEIVVPIDSSGRFTLRFAVSAPQQVTLDWGRMWKNIIVEPGETVLLYVDALDWKMYPNVSREEMINGKKNVLFMGKNARFHQEYAIFPHPLWMRDMYELREIARSDMEFLRQAEADYLKSVACFDSICRKYPNLSKRCREAIENDWKYRFAAVLMQNRFNLGNRRRFDPEYMEYVDTHFSVNEPLLYFITRDYETFLRDYTGYVDQQKYRYVKGVGWVYTSEDRFYEVLRRLKEKGMFEELSMEDIAVCENIDREIAGLMQRQITDSSAFQAVLREQGRLFGKMTAYRSLPEVREQELVMIREHELLLYDTLVPDALLRELCYAQLFVKGMELDHEPLLPGMMELADSRISNPLLNRKVKETSAVYQKIASKKLACEASLIDIGQFSHISNADSLWQALIGPYRGNVILFDFWGSWCEPCKEMLALMGNIEKVFENEEVVLSRVLKYPLRPQSVINEIKAELERE